MFFKNLCIMKILAISLPVFQNKGSITKFSQKLVLAHVI